MANENTPNRDLGTQGNKDVLSGKMKEVGGKAQEKAGQLTGNSETEAKGNARQMEGHIQKGAGNLERKVDKVTDE